MDASDRRKRAAEEAAEWWVLLQGEIPRVEREKYVDWLRESAVHVAEMLRVAQVHGALERFQGWSDLTAEAPSEETAKVIAFTGAAPPSAPNAGDRLTRRIPWGWSALAASLLVAVVVGFSLLRGSGQIIQTERGERREVALADGSTVQVDPETRLRLAYEPNARRVFLERGRALFHVAKNAKRPFLVEARQTTVLAVGTAFAVEQGGEAVIVTVAEGKVGVYPTHGTKETAPNLLPAPTSLTPAPAVQRPVSASRGLRTGEGPQRAGTGTGEPEIFLVANEQVTIAASGSAEPVQAVNSERVLAWAQGKLIFDDASVENAVAEFNRYNRIQLSIQDPALAQRRISGVFNAADPESFVAFLQSVTSVNVSRDEVAGIRIDRAH